MSATIISAYHVITRGSDKYVSFRPNEKREAIILAKRLSAKYSRTFTVQAVRESYDPDAEAYAEHIESRDLDSNGRPLHTCVLRETPDGYACAECLYA